MPSPKTATNMPLKVAIIESGHKQYQLARLININELRLSQIVTGRRVPNATERKAIARVLRRAPADLFPAEEDSHVA